MTHVNQKLSDDETFELTECLRETGDPNASNPSTLVDEDIGVVAKVAENSPSSSLPDLEGGLYKVLKTIREFATIASLLRFLGASAVVGSLSVFLLQSWDQGNDVYRYYLLLTQTVLLAASGFALTYLIKENKGARVFYGLSLASVPANFAILGALILSVTQWDSAVINVPPFATWSLGGATTVLGIVATAVAVLIPVSYFCLSIMARRSISRLIAPFLLLNMVLLVPVREPVLAGTLAVAAFLAALYCSASVLNQDSTLKTPEGRFASLMLFVPSILILVRTAALYQTDTILSLFIACIGYFTIRSLAIHSHPTSWQRAGLDVIGLIPILAIGYCAFELATQWLSLAFALPAFTLATGGLLFDTAFRSQASSTLFGRLATWVMSAGFIANTVIYPDWAPVIMCILAGVALVTMGLSKKDRSMARFGIITTAVSIAYLVSLIVGHVDLFNWMTLAAMGIGAIIVGSLIDVHGARIKLGSVAWLSQVMNGSAPSDDGASPHKLGLNR